MKLSHAVSFFFRRRVDFNFTAVLQVFENVLPFAVKAVISQVSLGRSMEMVKYTTSGRFEVTKLLFWHLSKKQFLEAALAMLYLLILIPLGFWATIYEKSGMVGKSNIRLFSNKVVNTSSFTDTLTEQRCARQELSLNMTRYISDLFELPDSHFYKPVALEYSNITSDTPGIDALREVGKDEDVNNFDVTATRYVINLADFYKNITYMTGNSLKINQWKYVWIPGRTQVELQIQRLYRTELNQVRNLDNIQEMMHKGATSILTDVYFHFYASVSNCTGSSTYSRLSAIISINNTSTLEYSGCKRYNLEDKSSNYILEDKSPNYNITFKAQISYYFQRDSYPSGYGYLNFIAKDQYRSSDLNREFKPKFNKLRGTEILPMLFRTSGGAYAVVFSNIDEYLVSKGVNRIFITVWISIAITLYIIGTYLNFWGVYVAGVNMTELIYRSCVRTDGDCAGNKISVLERILLPLSHLRAKTEYVFHRLDANKIHMTAAIDNKQLIALDLSVSGITTLAPPALNSVDKSKIREAIVSSNA